MTTCKNTFLITRSLYGNTNSLPNGDFLYYTCHNVTGASKLVFSRRLNNTEIYYANKIIKCWFNNGSIVVQSDMQIFAIMPIVYCDGIFIIQIPLNGVTRIERENLLIKCWNTTYSNINELEKYEILYFQAFPQNDVAPLCWELESFDKQHHIISYLLRNDKDEMVWVQLSSQEELYQKLKAEALKKTPNYVEHNGHTYYFDTVNDQIVCYFYSDKNPKCIIRKKPYNIHKSYVPPQCVGRKYIWLTHLPECREVGFIHEY